MEMQRNIFVFDAWFQLRVKERKDKERPFFLFFLNITLLLINFSEVKVQ